MKVQIPHWGMRLGGSRENQYYRGTGARCGPGFTLRWVLWAFLGQEPNLGEMTKWGRWFFEQTLEVAWMLPS